MVGSSTPRTGTWLRAAAAVTGAVLLGAAGCSGDAGPGAEAPSGGSSATTTSAPRPAGPAADLSTELRGGRGVFIGSVTPPDLVSAGYAEEELLATGTSSSYTVEGELTGDGRWRFEPGPEAPYRTRALVRRPAEAGRFSGTVIVEWLNVSGGVDADPEWTSTRDEIVRAGDAWVGVSAQRIGVEGGPVLVEMEGTQAAGYQGLGLKAIDPDRYGSLEHPGDGFSFDIFTQVARALRGGAGLGGLEPLRLVAAGESQSAMALVTYYNGVQPLTRAFDGFFVHSRAGGSLPLVGPGGNADIAGGMTTPPTILRTDQDTPVMDIQAEGDLTGVLRSYAARQDDGDSFRLWEVAGTAHADAHLIGPGAEAFDCGLPINNAPMHLVAKAALRALSDWLRTGTAPATAPRIEVTGGEAPRIARDADGIARGGVRTPPVEVPVAVLSGEPGPDPSPICLLAGSTSPLPAARLAELHPSREAYLARYGQAADETIEAGFVLGEDRDALMAFANPAALTG